ncbi:MAG: VWA domain-containing protein [Actinobacteria bacterium]|nr:MAG: VWA domain-containing protein [Actinomycetota bacterium]TML47083.1 MAG: VWA domain-containing protein [Actinomycetota bacterium]TML73820.1 MAG: VWA domain-containing protein [Actinomycetota bacterium]
MPGDALVRHVVTFGRVLHEAGLEVGPGRVQDALCGLDAVELTSQDDVYWTLRQTLVSRHDELDLFDRAFRAWFLRSPVVPPLRGVPVRQARPESLERSGPGADDRSESADGRSIVLGASTREILREKDFAEMTPDEFQRAKQLVAAIAQARPRRTSRRRYPDPRGEVLDIRRLVRRSLRTGGDPVDRPFRARKSVPRKLVLLCDVSGSMALYTRALLLFLHAAVGSGRGVEAFAFGTRLSRLTPDLSRRDPEAGLDRATAAAVDWGSGTRIGASVKELNDVYGRRALTRGAVVVVLSDGWEREDCVLLGREMARLQRAAYAVIWVNPIKGSPDYQPLAGGMQAALPFVDRFLPGHNLRSLEELAAVLAGIERRRAA